MKQLMYPILVFVFFFNCVNNENVKKEALGDTIVQKTPATIDTLDKIITSADVTLDSVEVLDESKEKQPAYINSRIKKFTDRIVTDWCKQAGFKELPDYILFRVFKHERQFEIWGRNGNHEKLKRIKTIEVCAIEPEPGPKLKSWDYNTAEGFYTYNIYYTSPSWYMFVKLTNEEVNNIGELDYGSCFKMFINYPNKLDKANSLKINKKQPSSGTICIHGNCVTACCVSFENNVWLTVFAFGLLHSNNYGLPHVYMFPCRFEKTDVRYLFREFSKYKPQDSLVLFPFWENLKEGYLKFEKEQQPLKYRAGKDKYYFDE